MHPLFPELDQLLDDHVTKHQVAQCRITYLFFLVSLVWEGAPIDWVHVDKILTVRLKGHVTGLLLGSLDTGTVRWFPAAPSGTFRQVSCFTLVFTLNARRWNQDPTSFLILLAWVDKTAERNESEVVSYVMQHYADIVCMCVCKSERYLFLCLCHLSSPGYSLLSWRVKRVQAGGTWGNGHVVFFFIVFVVFVSIFDFFPASFYFYLLSSLNLEIIITAMHFVYSKIECRQAVASCPWAMSSTVGSLFHWHIQGLGLSMSRLVKTDGIKGLVWCNYFSKDRIMLNGKYFWKERVNTSLCLYFVLHAYKHHNSQKKVNNQGAVLSMDSMQRT